MTCLNCESPNIAIELDSNHGVMLFCSDECYAFHLKTSRNEQMDGVIQSSKKYIKMMRIPNASCQYKEIQLKMTRMCQTRILLANQIKIGNLDLIQSMRLKYLEVLGELDEKVNELVKLGVREQFYIDICDTMKGSLRMFDNVISTIKTF